MKKTFLQPFTKYYIGIETADGKKHCIKAVWFYALHAATRWWYEYRNEVFLLNNV